MKKLISIVSCSALLSALAVMAPGCSSSQTSDSEFGDDVPAADAGTDAVPQSGDGEKAASADASPPPAEVASADPQAQTPPTTDPAAVPPPTDVAAATPPPVTPPVVDNKPADTTTAVSPVVASTESTPPVDTSHSSSTATSSPSGGSESYHVQSGDTLMRIAFEKYGDLYKWKSIYEANRDKIKDPNVILPGTVLTIENASNDLPAHTGKKYHIKHGDTLATISNDVYGTPSKWKKIWEHNKPWIPNPNKIFAGFFLYYTGGKDPDDIQQQDTPATPMASDSAAPVEAPRDPASTQTVPPAK